jgi:Lysine methyltransferase
LGAGLGLCGILSHHLAGPEGTVCITDGDTDALVLLRENIDRNTSDHPGKVSARQLIWGHDTTETFLRRHCHEGEPFDVLIASDIVYALVIVEPLWETIRLLLRRQQQEDNDRNTDRPCFLMAYAKRDVPVTIDMVLQAATKAGFAYELVDEDPEGIWIYSFWWNE